MAARRLSRLLLAIRADEVPGSEQVSTLLSPASIEMSAKASSRAYL